MVYLYVRVLFDFNTRSLIFPCYTSNLYLLTLNAPCSGGNWLCSYIVDVHVHNPDPLASIETFHALDLLSLAYCNMYYRAQGR